MQYSLNQTNLVAQYIKRGDSTSKFVDTYIPVKLIILIIATSSDLGFLNIIYILVSRSLKF